MGLKAERYIPSDQAEAMTQLWQQGINADKRLGDLEKLCNATVSTKQIIDMVKPLAREAFNYQFPVTYDADKNILTARIRAVDHGGLTGLADDDHTQYLLIAGTRAMTGALNMGSQLINYVANPVNDLDAVNYQTLRNSLTTHINYFLKASNVMASTVGAGSAFLTQTPTTDPETLSGIYFKTAVLNTPTPFTLDVGAEILIHTYAKVDSVTGKWLIKLSCELWYTDADGTSNPIQIGPASTLTDDTLTTSSVIQEMHITITTETTVPAGKRLWLKFISNKAGGSAVYPLISVEYGVARCHITIGTTGGILGNFVQKSGDTMSGALAMGTNKVTGLAAPSDAGDAIRQTAAITEAALGSAISASHARAHTLLSTDDHSDHATYIDQPLLTTSTPQFLRLGIGGTVHASEELYVTGTATITSNLAVGAVTPDSLLHIWAATAGTVAAVAGTLATIESNDNAYLSFLTPATKMSGINFGDPILNIVGRIIYDHSTDRLTTTISNQVRMCNTSTGTLFGDNSVNADSEIHIRPASAGTVTAAAGTVLTLESNTAMYMSLLVPALHICGILFGDEFDNDVSQLYYNNQDNTMHLISNTVERLLISSAGLISVANGFTVVGTTTLDTGLSGLLLATSGVVSAVTNTLHARAHVLLDSSDHSDSTTGTCTRGDIITAQGATPKWTRLAISVPAANVLNVLGIANGETESSWKALFDATNPAALGAVGPGTSLLAAHRDHVHAMPDHSALGALHQDVTTTATPQFARAGFGAAAGANNIIHIVCATGKTPIDMTAGAGGAWQIGQNVGGIGGDDTFGIYSATYGVGHSYNPILHLDGTTGLVSCLAGHRVTGQSDCDKLHVGGTSDPGDNNALIDGTLQALRIGSGVAPHATAPLYVGFDAGTGLSTIMGGTTYLNVYIASNTINASYAYDNDAGKLVLNYYGHNMGLTRYRSLDICDGKSNTCLFITGSTKLATFYGSVSLSSGDLSLIAGRYVGIASGARLTFAASNCVQLTDYLGIGVAGNTSFSMKTAGAVDVGTALTVNDGGGDYDTRIEGDNDTNLLFVDASTDRVGIGIATPDSKFHIWAGSAGTVSAVYSAGLTIENSGNTGLEILVPNASVGVFGVSSPAGAWQGSIQVTTNANPDLASMLLTGGTMSVTISGSTLDVPGLLQCNSFRIDQAAAAGTITCTHTIQFSANGVTYAFPCIAV